MYSAYKLNKQGETIQRWHTPFPIWNRSVPCPVNCCFRSCIQISQETGQTVWYFQLFQNFPQFIVVHTVKDFDIVNKAEINVFLTSLVAETVKRLSAMWETWVQYLAREVPWRRKWQPTPVILPRKSHGQRSLLSMGLQRVGHDWATSCFSGTLAFLLIQWMLAVWFLVPLPFLKLG